MKMQLHINEYYKPKEPNNKKGNKKQMEEHQKQKCDQLQKQQQQEKKLKKKIAYDNGAESRKIKNYAVSIVESANLRKNNGCCFLPKCTGDISEDMNSYFCICARNIGGMFSLLEKSNGTPIIITGSSWSTCVFCTVPIIVIFSFLVTWFIILDVENTLVSTINCLFFSTFKYILCYFHTSY